MGRKKAYLALGLPTYTRSRVWRGKGISMDDAKIVQEAARRKKAEISKRLKSKRFRERLAKQGIEVGDDVLKHVDEVVKATPVYASSLLHEGIYGRFTRGNEADAGTKTKHRRLKRARQDVRVDPTHTTPKKTKKVTAHEMEHAFDESFKDANPGMSLSEVQRPLLKRLGGKGSEGPSSLDHTRTDIMELRSLIGSEDVTAGQIKKYLEEHKRFSTDALPNWSRMLRRAVEANPGVSLEKIAEMINSVAIRRKRKKDTRLA